MLQMTVNYTAVVVAAAVHVVLGALWFGPIFGKEWMRLVGMTKETIEASKEKGMMMSYVLAVLAALVIAYVMGHVVAFADATTIQAGAVTGFWIWLGFVATIVLDRVLWEKIPGKLYALNVGFYLLSLMLMGAILAAW